jgi:hypothetical protein
LYKAIKSIAAKLFELNKRHVFSFNIWRCNNTNKKKALRECLQENNGSIATLYWNMFFKEIS